MPAMMDLPPAAGACAAPREGCEAARSGSEEIVELCLSLGAALHAYGTPAHELEYVLRECAANWGLEGQFFATPTAIFASMGAPAVTTTHLIRVEPGEADLEKLTLLHRFIDDIDSGRYVQVAEAREALRRITTKKNRYGPWLTTLSFALVSASAARFFGGSLADCAAAATMGAITALLAKWAEVCEPIGRIFVILTSFVVTTLALVSAGLFGSQSPYIITVSSLIVLVPGLSLTVALTELSARNLIAGTSRFMGALVVFLSMGFGVALGQALGGWLASPCEPGPALPGWTEALALVMAPISFTVLFRARPADALPILLAGALGYLGARVGSTWIGPQLGAFAGAFLVGLGSHLDSRLYRRPPAVTMLPGIVLLVPGSVGFQSVFSLLEQDVVAGVDTAFTMSLVAISIVAGLLVANALLPPRRTRRGTYVDAQRNPFSGR